MWEFLEVLKIQLFKGLPIIVEFLEVIDSLLH